MATRTEAARHAQILADRIGETAYLIYDGSDDGSIDRRYHAASSYDLDTFYGGIAERDILEAFSPSSKE